MAISTDTRLTPGPKFAALKLRHYVTIQQITETRGADGSVVETWGTFANVWADVRPVSGSENFAAQGITASTVHLVDIRYLSGVVPKMRVLWGERVFEIESVRNIEERDRWMTLACVEEV